MSLIEKLLRSERELADGDGELYRRRLTDDALVVLPGMAMSREECAQAVDAGPGAWQQIDIADERLAEPAEGVAVVSYRFDGRRAEGEPYSALMSSVYVESAGEWLLALHQQTPLSQT